MKLLLAGLLGLMFLTPAYAENPLASGVATVPHDKRRASPEVRERGLRAAELNAIEGYAAELGQAAVENFDLIRASVAAEIDHYIIGEGTILGEEDRPHQYKVSVRIKINEPRLLARIKVEAHGPGPRAPSGSGLQEKSTIAFVFVARGKSSITEMGPTTTRRLEVTDTVEDGHSKQDNGRKTERQGRGSIVVGSSRDTKERGSTTATHIVTSGGMRSRERATATWTILPADELDTIVSDVFAQSGFKPTSAELVQRRTNGLLNVTRMREEYQMGDNLQPDTLSDAAQGLHVAGVPYLALATMDVGLPDEDPHSGGRRVVVKVTARLIDVTGEDPVTVASVGPVQFQGLGPDDDVAQTNALKAAAQEAARGLVLRSNSQAVN